LIPFSDTDAQRRSRPVVNYVLIAINALIFLYALQLGGSGYLWGGSSPDVFVFFLKWGFIPEELGSGRSFTQLGVGLRSVDIESPLPTWTTLFSSLFIHGGLFHFAGNMAFLWVFGDNIENRLGHVKYLVFYLVVGVAATLSHFAIDPNSQSPLVGASGAIAGVMGAYLLLFPFNRIKALVIFYFITVIELQALVFLGIWFFLQIINSVGALGLSAGVNVAFMAHVGGFVAGVVLIAGFKLLSREPIIPSRQRRNPWDYWYQSGRGPD
jgi:membrane associated rhomboid family serine protease